MLPATTCSKRHEFGKVFIKANSIGTVYLAQTAEQTREIAANTLDALHQQGQKLEVVERDLYEVRFIL